MHLLCMSMMYIKNQLISICINLNLYRAHTNNYASNSNYIFYINILLTMLYNIITMHHLTLYCTILHLPGTYYK